MHGGAKRGGAQRLRQQRKGTLVTPARVHSGFPIRVPIHGLLTYIWTGRVLAVGPGLRLGEVRGL